MYKICKYVFISSCTYLYTFEKLLSINYIQICIYYLESMQKLCKNNIY